MTWTDWTELVPRGVSDLPIYIEMCFEKFTHNIVSNALVLCSACGDETNWDWTSDKVLECRSCGTRIDAPAHYSYSLNNFFRISEQDWTFSGHYDEYERQRARWENWVHAWLGNPACEVVIDVDYRE